MLKDASRKYGKPPEVNAGLAARCRMVMQAYGGRMAFAKHFGIRYITVKRWHMIPHNVATMIHNDQKEGQRITANFCRPDLRFKDGQMLGDKFEGNRRVFYT